MQTQEKRFTPVDKEKKKKNTRTASAPIWFWMICGGCAVRELKEQPKRGDLNKSPAGSINQKYVYTYFMVNMMINSGSFRLFGSIWVVDNAPGRKI